MFTQQELQVVIKTLTQRRDWLAKNLDSPDVHSSQSQHQQTLQLLDSALQKLSTADPVAAHTLRSTEANSQVPPEKIRVLIVDDDSLITMLLSTLLMSLGIKKIDLAEDGHQAISMIYDAKPAYHLVLCDWNMPIKNGLDVHNAMRASERYQQACFMLVTAVTEAKQIRAAISEGVDDYIVKPIDELTFKRKIARAFPSIQLAE